MPTLAYNAFGEISQLRKHKNINVANRAHRAHRAYLISCCIYGYKAYIHLYLQKGHYLYMNIYSRILW